MKNLNLAPRKWQFHKSGCGRAVCTISLSADKLEFNLVGETEAFWKAFLICHPLIPKHCHSNTCRPIVCLSGKCAPPLSQNSNPVYFLRTSGIPPVSYTSNGFFQGMLSSQFVTILVIPLSIKDPFSILCIPLAIAQLFLSLEVSFLEKQSVLVVISLWTGGNPIHASGTFHQNHAVESHKWCLGCKSQRAFFNRYFTSLFGICHCWPWLS